MPTRYVDEMLEPASPHRASFASILYSVGTFSSPLYIWWSLPRAHICPSFPHTPFSRSSHA